LSCGRGIKALRGLLVRRKTHFADQLESAGALGRAHLLRIGCARRRHGRPRKNSGTSDNENHSAHDNPSVCVKIHDAPSKHFPTRQNITLSLVATKSESKIFGGICR
jgi:hypothetical protein